jgi:hypothetical protein
LNRGDAATELMTEAGGQGRGGCCRVDDDGRRTEQSLASGKRDGGQGSDQSSTSSFSRRGKTGQRGQNTPGARLEEGEKNGRLTRRTSACSGKPKQDLSCRIAPATGEEEEDHAVDSWRLASILRAETILATRRRRRRRRGCLIEGELLGTTPWRGGRGGVRELT